MNDSGLLIFKTVARDLISNKIEVSYGTQATSYYRNWAVESSVVGKIIFGKFEDIPEPVFNMMFGARILVEKVADRVLYQRFSLLPPGTIVVQDNLMGGAWLAQYNEQIVYYGSWFAYNDYIANLFIVVIKDKPEHTNV